MSCRDAIHLMCWYLEGKLTEGVEQEIRVHLGSCAQCRVVLEAATATLDRFFASPNPEAVSTTSRAA